MTTKTLPTPWTVADSLELYNVPAWANDYFSVGEAGSLLVQPAGSTGPQLDLKELVDATRLRGLAPPFLFRFLDLLDARIREIDGAFQRAILDNGYRGGYQGVYPIKVNQDRHVVERLVEAGGASAYGLEAGSKPELLAVLGLIGSEEQLIVCNGYKDEEYLETALLGSKLGRTIIVVIEKPSELPMLGEISRRTGVRPRIGIRVRLSSRGSGHWEASGGDRSKFGLGAREVTEALRFLREADLLDCFELLHFHLGSQISNIRSVKGAVREAGRMYVELAKAGAALRYLDVGGGLAIDYDGSQTNFSSSMNYTLQEYANDIVFAVGELCDQEDIPHPTIISESGRAAVGHHAVLVVDVLGVGELRIGAIPDELDDEAHPPLRHLLGTYQEVNRKNFLEAYHDALQYRDEALSLFNLGHLSLEERVLAEDLFLGICQKILRITRELPEPPEELEALEPALADTYFCNFSVFQSIPDSWAIDQLFPILPVHRLHEEPTRRGILADITCDSDGKVDRFIDRRDVKDVLELHPVRAGEDYYLGIFLVGAYQEILGDLHNLFGDTNIIHVAMDEAGEFHIDHVVKGDSVTDVLKYVGYDRDDLVARMRRSTEVALREKRITLEESRALLKMYEEGLAGYTYLERD